MALGMSKPLSHRMSVPVLIEVWWTVKLKVNPSGLKWFLGVFSWSEWLPGSLAWRKTWMWFARKANRGFQDSVVKRSLGIATFDCLTLYVELPCSSTIDTRKFVPPRSAAR